MHQLDRSRRHLPLLLLAATGALFATCAGSSDSDETAIDALVRQQYTAANARDFDAWSSLFTDAGLQQAIPDTDDRSREGLRKRWLAGPGGTYTLYSVSDIAVNGSEGGVTGTTSITGRGGDPDSQMVYAVRDRLLKSGGVWKIDAKNFVSPALPEGARVVHITARESSYAVDASDLADGTFAIEFENAGTQTHQIHLVRIAPHLDILNFLRGGESSLENVDIGSTSLVAAGDSVNVPFSAPLPKGRYVMYCSLPDTADPAQTPHSQKGMYQEFTVR